MDSFGSISTSDGSPIRVADTCVPTGTVPAGRVVVRGRFSWVWWLSSAVSPTLRPTSWVRSTGVVWCTCQFAFASTICAIARSAAAKASDGCVELVDGASRWMAASLPCRTSSQRRWSQPKAPVRTARAAAPVRRAVIGGLSATTRHSLPLPRRTMATTARSATSARPQDDDLTARPVPGMRRRMASPRRWGRISCGRILWQGLRTLMSWRRSSTASRSTTLVSSLDPRFAAGRCSRDGRAGRG